MTEVPAFFWWKPTHGRFKKMNSTWGLVLDLMAANNKIDFEPHANECNENTERRVTTERRTRSTFIANDRRIGLADRRKKMPSF
jgi:hypothetical protein